MSLYGPGGAGCATSSPPGPAWSSDQAGPRLALVGADPSHRLSTAGAVRRRRRLARRRAGSPPGRPAPRWCIGRELVAQGIRAAHLEHVVTTPRPTATSPSLLWRRRRAPAPGGTSWVELDRLGRVGGGVLEVGSDARRHRPTATRPRREAAESSSICRRSCCSLSYPTPTRSRDRSPQLLQARSARDDMLRAVIELGSNSSYVF